VGYVLTSAVSPDAPLLEACAKYIAAGTRYARLADGAEENGDGGAAAWENVNAVRKELVQAISGMTATTPEGWRALAEAADDAAAHDGPFGNHAAAMIFVMQCSLLGKRKRLRGQEMRMLLPASDALRAPAASAIPSVPAKNMETFSPKADSATTPTSNAPVPESYKASGSKKIAGRFRVACDRAFAGDAHPPSSLPAKIREHEEVASASDSTWESLAAWLHIMDTSASSGLGRLYATA